MPWRSQNGTHEPPDPSLIVQDLLIWLEARKLTEAIVSARGKSALTNKQLGSATR
jgi:hypothetical protein